MMSLKMLIIALFSGTILGGCGNTISGVGKDISDVGAKVTKWQNEEDKKDAK